MLKISFFTFFFIPIVFFAQKNERYSFASLPSFHNGFEIEFDDNTKIIKFHTLNIYYILDSLKDNYKTYPKAHYEDQILVKNQQLLSNSTFEKNVSEPEIINLKRLISEFADVCKENKGENKSFDGIFFETSTPRMESCKIQYSQGKEKKLVDKLLLKIEDIFKPNSFLDRYIFDTRQYLENDICFNIKSTNPLFLKLYQMSNSGCYFFVPMIDKLPDTDEIYIDISELPPNIKEDDKECFIETINKKYKKVIIIQAKETSTFNEM